MPDVKHCYCEKCQKTMREEEFYSTNNLEKYPTGKLKTCKKCTTMHVDNWNPKTYLWILQECDVPYVPDVWNRLLERYGNSKRATGLTIVGRYLSAMRINQYADFRWKDSEFLQELRKKKYKDSLAERGYSPAEIAEKVENEYAPVPARMQPIPENVGRPSDDVELGSQAAPFIKPGVIASQDEDDFENDLTDEDKKMLRLKWGRNYTPYEWVRLETLYQNMMNSYDVQGAGHEDTLKFVCKTSLKADQLLDAGDIDGARKMLKMYGDTMKSGKFTAVQNKQDNADEYDAIGTLIEAAEKEGYIERFYVTKPNDQVDFTLQDFKRFTQNLVDNETNLSNKVEEIIMRNRREDEASKAALEEDIFDDSEGVMTDEDYAEYSNFIEEEARKDEI